MEGFISLRAAVVDLLYMIDNPPKVDHPYTTIKHALLSCMESYGPTMEMLERQATYQSRPIEASGELGRVEAGAVSCFRPEPGVNCYVLKPIGQFSSLSCVVSPTTGGHALCLRLPEPPND